MRVHKTPWLRRLGVLVGIASLGSGIVGAPAAHADKIADKKAEAARIAAQVEAQGEKVSILAERLDAARLRAESVQAGVATAKADLAKTDALVAERRQALKGYVVSNYIKGGKVSSLQMLMGGGESAAGALAVRTSYVKVVTGNERAALDELFAARELADAKRSKYEDQQKDARTALAAVDSQRRAAAAAEAAARATLNKVQGELSALVAEETQRRAAEAERRAQAELAARQSRQQATRSRGGSTGVDPGPAPAPNAGAAAAVAEAKRQIGKRYEYGAAGPNSFDCSGLTMWSWRAGGVSLPHSSSAQYSATRRVSMADIAPGDLLFYGSPIHHVGIYVGNGTMVEAPHSGVPVRYASIYRDDLAGIGRVG